MMTAHWTRDSAEWAEARRIGAEALFEKPFRDVNLVTMQVRQLLESRRLRHENVVLRQTTAEQGFAGIIGRSPIDARRVPAGRDGVPHQQHRADLRRVGHRQGAGRARDAHAVAAPRPPVRRGQLRRHAGGAARIELFGHVRGAFTGADKDKKGLIEAADGGTLFLDEIGEMPPTMQVKLLRVLQERKYRRSAAPTKSSSTSASSPRPIAICRSSSATGKFREDLFYRLNVIPVKMPPLRERAEDIPLLAEHFLAKYTREMSKPIDGVLAEALRSAARLPLARQRPRARERGRAGGRARIGAAHRSRRRCPRTCATAGRRRSRPGPRRDDRRSRRGFNLERHLQDIERSHLERALERAGGVQTRAADVLGLSFRQFRYLPKKYGLK